jgi:hypothetical protein
VERGVFIGGLMICGSFLLAALLNRSAMDEIPAAPAAPAAVAAPMRGPALEAEAAPTLVDCNQAEPRANTSSVAKTEQPAPDLCNEAD